MSHLRNTLFLVHYITLICGLFLLPCSTQMISANESQITLKEGWIPNEGHDHRIISMAPSITEILFALGLGEQVVGVTDYCHYPEEAQSKKSIGGFINPNFEAILLLQPDLVILFEEHEKPRRWLAKSGIRTLTLPHETLSEIQTSILTIAEVCRRQPQGSQITQDIQYRIKRVQQKTSGLRRPRVLVAVERSVGLGQLRDVCVASKNTFYDELVNLAGGENVYQGQGAYPVISTEGLIRLDPEVILDIFPERNETVKKQDALAEWQDIASVTAVKKGQVHLFTDHVMVIPGPRFVDVLEAFASVIHPEIDWKEQ